MVEVSDFRNAMARLAGAVNVITTDGPQGLAGFTATAVCSVTDQPPTLLVCMNRASYAYPIFAGNGVLCVNVLAAEQESVSGLFADRQVTMDERFARIDWRRLATGSPLIDGAVASFDCRVVEMHEVGSHSVFLSEVQGISQGDSATGLVYFDRKYHGIGETEALQC